MFGPNPNLPSVSVDLLYQSHLQTEMMASITHPHSFRQSTKNHNHKSHNQSSNTRLTQWWLELSCLQWSLTGQSSKCRHTNRGFHCPHEENWTNQMSSKKYTRERQEKLLPCQMALIRPCFWPHFILSSLLVKLIKTGSLLSVSLVTPTKWRRYAGQIAMSQLAD